MNAFSHFASTVRERDPIAWAALAISLLALLFSMAGGAFAWQRLGSSAVRSASGGNHRKFSCPTKNAISLGTWCIDYTPQPVPASSAGQNNFLYAAQACVKEGGWLPSAAQLIGAAAKVRLQSTIDDDPLTSGAEEFPSAKNGIKDKREMSGDLFTTTAGSEAAGSEGVTEGARGNASLGEPDPTPMPGDPLPNTLDYVTVFDNHNLGGFAGGEAVGAAETFRCAYAKGWVGKKGGGKRGGGKKGGGKGSGR